MNDDDRAFERAIQGLMDDGSDRTPSDTIDAVLLAVRTTPQERDLRIPWRTPPMSNPMRLVAAIAVVVVVGVAVFNLFRPSAGVGGVSSPSPSSTVAPSAPAPTPIPQPSTSLIDTTTWTIYTSNRYGFSIGHPADWTSGSPADHNWASPKDSDPDAGATEDFHSPDGHVRVSAWSVPVQPGTSADAWLLAYCPRSSVTCLPNRIVAVSVDGHAGSLMLFQDDTQAFILVGDRMYVVAVWVGDSTPEVASYGGAQRLLEGYLSTMHLLPGGPAPSSPTPGPS